MPKSSSRRSGLGLSHLSLLNKGLDQGGIYVLVNNEQSRVPLQILYLLRSLGISDFSYPHSWSCVNNDHFSLVEHRFVHDVSVVSSPPQGLGCITSQAIESKSPKYSIGHIVDAYIE